MAADRLVLLSLIVLSLTCALTDAAKKVVKEKHASDEFDTVSEVLQYSLEIQHAIGTPSQFTRRGVVHLRTLKPSSSVSFQQDLLSTEDLALLKEAALTGGKYFIRAGSNLTENRDEEITEAGGIEYVQTFISACAMWRGRLSDYITIHGDGRGNVVGLTLMPKVPNNLHCTEENIGSSAKSSFSSSVSYTTGSPGPTPETQRYLQKLEEERLQKEGQDNRSFFQKYWMYIVGFIALQLFLTKG